MCGLAGALRPGASPDELRAVAGAMAVSLAHRGPDDQGVWVDAGAGLAFGHRRLAVLDLSVAGRQPMTDASGRFTLVYNGELYNHRALRAELEAGGARFRGTSDTEVLVEAIARWPLAEVLRRADGMFALAVHDARERRLLLARDRFGEKPLYYGTVGDWFAFSSELRALREVPGFRLDVDRDSLALLLRHGCVPAPRSILVGVRKLTPGSMVEVRLDERGAAPVESAWWSAREVGHAAAGRGLDVDLDEAADLVEEALAASVERRLESDVPLGAFLSGGIDSALVVAAMRRIGRDVHTFSVGFRDPRFDESQHARAVAQQLGTRHVELVVDEPELLATVPRLGAVWDEPFADSSQIPMLLVAELARQHVTVALSGDGADELFGGYARHRAAARVAEHIRRVPGPARRAAAGILARPSPGTWDGLARRMARVAGRDVPSHVGDKVHKYARALAAPSGRQAYAAMLELWSDDAVVVGGRGGHAWPLLDADGGDVALRAMLSDTVGYLPDDILVKVDRAAMAVSLETRVPFLEPELYELAWRLPLGLRTDKAVLRHLLRRQVPAAAVERPKTGFAAPIGRWLQGPLRAWGEALLDPDRLRVQGYLDPGPVGERWRRLQRGDTRAKHELWAVLMFQAWLEQWSAVRA